MATRKLILKLHMDDSAEDPSGFDGQWKLYSFSNRHRSFEHPDKFFPDGKPSIGLRRKLDVGLAFVLSYYEHGQCAWSRQGRGPQCQWDSVGTAGLLVWEHKPKEMGAKSYEDRAKDADAFLETYTNWCNGNVYGYQIEEEVTLPCGHVETRDLDSCFGFYEAKHMAEEVRACLREGDEVVRVEGQAKDLADYVDFVTPAKRVA